MNAPKHLLGEKCWLGPVEVEHLGAIRGWRNSWDVAGNSYQSPEITAEIHNNWYSRYLEDKDQVRFVIHAPDVGPVGVCGLNNRRELEGSAELLVFIGEPKARRQGLALDALRTMLDWAFGEWGLRRVELEVFVNNAPAIALYRKLGFDVEGVKQAAHVDALTGAYVDAWVMALLRGKWEVLA